MRSPRTLLVTLFAFVVAACWSFASPRQSGPDEPAHAVRAAGLAHGQLIGERIDGQPTTTRRFDLPVVIGSGSPACYAFQPNVSAECAPFDTSGATGELTSLAATYPPTAYLLPGIASRLSTHPAVLWLMRLASIVPCALAIGTAWWLASRTRRSTRALRLGVLIALTPMSLFLFGVLNPNGLEIAAMTPLWVVLAGSLRDRALLADRRAATLAIGWAAIALLTRQAAFVWVAAVFGVVAIAGGRAYTAELIKRWWKYGAGLAAATVVQLGWVVATGTTSVPTNPYVDRTFTQAEATRAVVGGAFNDNVRELIGRLGWLDTPAPWLTTLIIMGVVLGLVGVGVSFAARREGLALALLCAFVFAFPLASEALSAKELGFFWQGRYILPVAIGIPIVAAVFASDFDWPSLVRRRVMVLVPGLVWIAHVAMFTTALRRYSVGNAGRLIFVFGDTPWSPPGGVLAWLILYALAFGGYTWAMVRPDRDQSLLTGEALDHRGEGLHTAFTDADVAEAVPLTSGK